MKKTSLVIWDFNGTLLDDTGISIEAINTVLSRRGLKTVQSKEEFQNIFTFPVEEYYRRLGFDFEKEPFTVPADEWVKLYDEKKFFSPAVEGAPETVKKLSGMGVRQIVLSACEKNLLRSQLEKIGILACFDEILGSDDFYAAGKLGIAAEWVAAKDPEVLRDALFVGDTDHDLECARVIGCGCVLYSGGFMSRSRLEALGAPVIDDIRRVCDFIGQNAGK